MECINILDKKYEKDIGGEPSHLTVKIGNKHECISMLLDYSVKGKVKIDMQDYIDAILEDLPKGFDSEAVTPATSYLFEVNDECKKLNQVNSKQLHHIFA